MESKFSNDEFYAMYKKYKKKYLNLQNTITGGNGDESTVKKLFNLIKQTVRKTGVGENIKIMLNYNNIIDLSILNSDAKQTLKINYKKGIGIPDNYDDVKKELKIFENFFKNIDKIKNENNKIKDSKNNELINNTFIEIKKLFEYIQNNKEIFKRDKMSENKMNLINQYINKKTYDKELIDRILSPEATPAEAKPAATTPAKPAATLTEEEQEAADAAKEAKRIAAEEADQIKEAKRIAAEEADQAAEEEAKRIAAEEADQAAEKAKQAAEAADQAAEEAKQAAVIAAKKAKKIAEKEKCDNEILDFLIDKRITDCEFDNENDLENIFKNHNTLDIANYQGKCKGLAQNQINNLRKEYNKCKTKTKTILSNDQKIIIQKIKNIENKQNIAKSKKQNRINAYSDEEANNLYQGLSDSDTDTDTDTASLSNLETPTPTSIQTPLLPKVDPSKDFSIKVGDKFLIFNINKNIIDEYKNLDCTKQVDVTKLNSFVRDFGMFHQSKITDEIKTGSKIIAKDKFREKMTPGVNKITNAFIITITKVNQDNFEITLSKNKSMEKDKLKEEIDKLLDTVINNTKRIEDNCYKIDYKIPTLSNDDELLDEYYKQLNLEYSKYINTINITKTEDIQKINVANQTLKKQLDDIKNELKLESPHKIKGQLNETVEYTETGKVLVGNKKLLELINKEISDITTNSLIFKLSIDDIGKKENKHEFYRYGEFINKFRPYSAFNLTYLLLDSAIIKKRILDLN